MNFKILGLLWVFAILLSMMWLKIEKQKKARRANVKRSVKLYFPFDTYITIYNSVQRSALFRKDIQSIYDRLSTLGIYTPTEQVVETVNFFIKSTALFAVLSIVGIVMYNSIHMIIITIIFAKVVKDLLIYKQLEGVKMRLLNDFSTTLSSISLQYTMTNNVVDALSNATCGPLTQKMVQRIIDVLQAGEDKEEMLEMFYKQIPFPPIQTLAQVCYITSVKGDNPTPNGESSFVAGVNEVANETMMEIAKYDKIKKAFGILEYLPLVVVPGLSLVEKGFGRANPAMVLLYNGPYGYWVKLIILVGAVICYTIIINLRNTDSSKESDRSTFIDYLLENKKFYEVCKNSITTDRFKINEMHSLFRKALSKQDLVHIQAKKILYASVIVVVCLFLSIYSVVSSKMYYYNNITIQSMMQQKPYTQEETKMIKKMDARYLSFKELPSKTATEKYVLKYLPELGNLELEAQVYRLMGKYEQYHQIEYKWYYVLIVYILGFLSTKAPEMKLRMRAKTIQKEAKAEVLQLQTTLGLILNTNMDTMDALFWLEKQANIYKNSIMECFQNFTANAEESLEILRDSSEVVEFKKLIDSLTATIQSSTLSEAFSNIRSERAYTLASRERELTHIVESRRRRASYYALGPAFAVLAFYAVVPMMYMGAKEMIRAFETLH